MQRFVWDLMYPNPPSDGYDLPISAIYKDTPFVPQGPAVLPGAYTIKLTANGRTFTKVLTVRMDPRIKTPAAGLQQQYTLSMQAYEGLRRSYEIGKAAKKLSDDIAKRRPAATTDAQKAKLDAIDAKIKILVDGPPHQPGTPVPVADFPLGRLAEAYATLLELLQDADVAPSTQAITASKDLQTALAKVESSWKEITDMTAQK